MIIHYPFRRQCFFAIDDGKRPKQVNSSKDEDDQCQLKSSGPTRDNQPNQVLEPDQRYYQNTTNDYIDDPVDFGDEVSSPIASTTKIFWEKALLNKGFQHKMKLCKIPSNCQFLQPKRKNVEILSVIPPSSCSGDRGIQNIQTITAASASLILQAASDISQYLVAASKSRGGKIDIMPPLTKIKDALSVARKASQELNQLWRNMIKPYLPPQFEKLEDISDDSKNFLF